MKRYEGRRGPHGVTVAVRESWPGSDEAGYAGRHETLHNLKHWPVHSPDGFEWGYGGSGPSDLALAILADHLGVQEQIGPLWDRAWELHHAFKDSFVAHWAGDQWHVTDAMLDDWIKSRVPA